MASVIIARRASSRGFTLIEVITVVAILVIMMFFALQAVQRVREAASRASCSNNLRQLGIALHSYENANQCFPMARNGALGASYITSILPGLEQAQVYNTLNFNSDDGIDHAMCFQIPNLICPSDRIPAGWMFGATSYAGNRGSGVQAFGYNGLFAKDKIVRVADVVDGSSQTAAISEWLLGPPTPNIRDARRSVFATDGSLTGKSQLDAFSTLCRDVDDRKARLSSADIGTPYTHGEFGRTLYNHVMRPNEKTCTNGTRWQQGAWSAKSGHPGGVNLLFADGHILFVGSGVELQVWRSLGSRDGGEIVPGDK